MSQNLYEASHQWSTRPDDERFASIEEMYKATRQFAENARTALVPLDTLRVEANNGDISLVGKTGVPAKLTHFAFGQLARTTKAPAEYLRSLPATLATQNLNYGLKDAAKRRENDKLSILFHQNGELLTRAITSDSYDRVWNHEIVAKIAENMTPNGWQVPPARPARPNQKGTRKATAADILPNQKDFGLAIKEGDLIAPAGLYASDHDMFAFLVKMGVNDGIEDGGKLLNRGVFIQNSEVGDCSLRFKFFVFDHVCGNMICWGVSNVTDVAVRHVKSEAARRGNTLQKAMSKWNVMVNQLPAAGEVEKGIKAARAFEVAAKKEDVLDAIFKFAKTKNLTRINRDVLGAAYEVAERNPRYGSPNTLWAMVNGLTEVSQQTAYTDVRVELDMQAGKVLEMSF